MTIHKIVDVVTGEETLMDYTKSELDERKASQDSVAAALAIQSEKATAKAAVLSKLGLTAEEAEALIS